MAKIQKQGDKVTLTMTTDEAVLLQDLIERAGTVSARAKHCTGNNSLAYQKAELSMKAMWSLSDHLSIPTDPKHSYEMDFRLP